jgi:hypothetical protein
MLMGNHDSVKPSNLLIWLFGYLLGIKEMLTRLV